jgi:hypothetical protein
VFSEVYEVLVMLVEVFAVFRLEKVGDVVVGSAVYALYD